MSLVGDLYRSNFLCDSRSCKRGSLRGLFWIWRCGRSWHTPLAMWQGVSPGPSKQPAALQIENNDIQIAYERFDSRDLKECKDVRILAWAGHCKCVNLASQEFWRLVRIWLQAPKSSRCWKRSVVSLPHYYQSYITVLVIPLALSLYWFQKGL